METRKIQRLALFVSAAALLWLAACEKTGTGPAPAPTKYDGVWKQVDGDYEAYLKITLGEGKTCILDGGKSANGRFVIKGDKLEYLSSGGDPDPVGMTEDLEVDGDKLKVTGEEKGVPYSFEYAREVGPNWNPACGE